MQQDDLDGIPADEIDASGGEVEVLVVVDVDVVGALPEIDDDIAVTCADAAGE
jgi:hypothetical protein